MDKNVAFADLGMDSDTQPRINSDSGDKLIVQWAPMQSDASLDHFVKDGLVFAGTHLIIDLVGASRLVTSRMSGNLAGSGGRIRGHCYICTSPFLTEWRCVGCCGACRVPYQHPYMAGAGLCRSRRIHVRRCEAAQGHCGAASGFPS